MKAKSKQTLTNHHASANLRLAYTWHLRPPFNELFCADQWWKGTPAAKVNSIAALYELTRRHPRIGELRQKYLKEPWHGRELDSPQTHVELRKWADCSNANLGPEPAAIHCLCLIGLKAWPQLDEGDQEYWETSAGKIKGVDCRDSFEQCTPLVSIAWTRSAYKQLRTLKLHPQSMQFSLESGRGDSSREKVSPVNPSAHNVALKKLIASLKENQILSSEVEANIARQAISAYRSGELLFSVAPDLANEVAAKLLADEYRAEKRHFGTIAQRARWTDWLHHVAAFEDDELKHDGSKAPVFTAYRRIIDGIEFDRKRPHLRF